MRIVTVLGARPQFIKAAALSREFSKNSHIKEIIVHTGQHYDQNMSEVFFDEMGIPKPKYILKTGGKSHGAMTGQQLEEIEKFLIDEQPDIMIVYGDINSTLAATKLHNSYNRKILEEINKVLVNHISNILFATNEVAKQNLLKKSIDLEKIYVVGDIMYDVVLYYQTKVKKLLWFDISTIYRAENTDDSNMLRDIFVALSASKKDIILLLYPRTAKKVKESSITIFENIHIVESVGYLGMVWLQKKCELIITDSGECKKKHTFQTTIKFFSIITLGYL